MGEHALKKQWIRVVGLLVGLTMAGASCCTTAGAAVKQLNALGTAVVHEKDLVAGRKNAVADALVSAVGQVVVEMLTSETVVRRFKLIKQPFEKMISDSGNAFESKPGQQMFHGGRLFFPATLPGKQDGACHING